LPTKARAALRADELPRQRILAAARTLLLAKGHRHLSLREVSRLAGYSPASLYEHFLGKDAIVEALAAEASQALRTALARAAARPGPAARRLVGIGLAYVRFARQRPEDFQLLFSQLPSGRRSLAQAIPQRSPYQVVVDAVQALLPGAEGRPAAVEELAYGLWATAHGMAMLQLTHLEGFEAGFDEVDRRVLEALVAGWPR
jgi:AcrR family transcriptional regulator